MINLKDQGWADQNEVVRMRFVEMSKSKIILFYSFAGKLAKYKGQRTMLKPNSFVFGPAGHVHH
jgi:hypothetical protein